MIFMAASSFMKYSCKICNKTVPGPRMRLSPLPTQTLQEEQRCCSRGAEQACMASKQKPAQCNTAQALHNISQTLHKLSQTVYKVAWTTGGNVMRSHKRHNMMPWVLTCQFCACVQHVLSCNGSSHLPLPSSLYVMSFRCGLMMMMTRQKPLQWSCAQVCRCACSGILPHAHSNWPYETCASQKNRYGFGYIKL